MLVEPRLLLTSILEEPVLLSHAPIPVRIDEVMRTDRDLVSLLCFFLLYSWTAKLAKNHKKSLSGYPQQGAAPRDELVEGNLPVIVDVSLSHNAIYKVLESFGIKARSFRVESRPGTSADRLR